jgi:tryptophanyl-tRNA synthetase
VVTDSSRPQEPKDPDACTLVALLDAFADPQVAAEVRTRYRSGGIGYGEVKALLADELRATLGPMRECYEALCDDPQLLDAALEAGEERANARAERVLGRVTAAVGVA